MINAMQNFNFLFQNHKVCVMTDEQGNPWFMAKDVCDILDYSNHNETIKYHCDAKGVAKSYPLQTSGGIQYPVFINEGNLYRLIIKSNKSEAKLFEAWICDEVLPAIRKTGSYIDTERKLTTLSQKEIYRNLAVKAAELRKALPAGTRITDTCNLWTSGNNKSTSTGKNQEKSQYLRQMDEFNLPGIVVIEKKPVTLVFDWLQVHKHDQALVEALFKELGALCAGYQCLASYCKAKPFELAGNLEELTGFKTIQEAQNLAETMRSRIADKVVH